MSEASDHLLTAMADLEDIAEHDRDSWLLQRVQVEALVSIALYLREIAATLDAKP